LTPLAKIGMVQIPLRSALIVLKKGKMTEWENKTKCLTFGGYGRRVGGVCGADKNVCLQLFIVEVSRGVAGRTCLVLR
jgi:hypothetical protein